ncbi:MAG: hypothetical protein AB7U05_09175 [Mangrovibacterium sp.]
MFTPEQTIILHELASQVLAGLQLNSEKHCFEMPRPLSLSFELSEYRALEETTKQLAHVLENLPAVAHQADQPAVAPV